MSEHAEIVRYHIGHKRKNGTRRVIAWVKIEGWPLVGAWLTVSPCLPLRKKFARDMVRHELITSALLFIERQKKETKKI